MPYSEKIFDTAHSRLERRKDENRRISERRREEVCRVLPEYSALEIELADTMKRFIEAIADKRENSREILEKSLAENAAIQRRMAELLIGKGFPADYLDPIYTCGICHDTGSVDGHWCECFDKLLKVAASEEMNASSPLKLSTFESFDVSRYPDTFDPELGDKQNEIMSTNLRDCKDFAGSFDGKGSGLFMIGGTGLGKTHLSLAIANEVIKKGYSVIYDSAPELMRQLEKEAFGRADTDTMQLITNCDLLILDDLGAEMKNERYISFVYEIVNSRQNRQLPLIVNSNLTIDELEARYQKRIVSRLFSLNVLFFCGKDNRMYH